MFRTPSPNTIESDEGFSVRVLGRVGLRYTQGDKTMFIDSEILAVKDPAIVIASSIQHWDPPYDKEIIDNKTKKQIVENIRGAFASQGHNIDVTY